jgi:hypothetical protein
MSKSESIPKAPSLAKILVATVVALIVAAIVLVVAILPAEYGIDPLGTGKALGLTELAKAGEQPESAAPPAADEATSISPVLVQSPAGDAPTYKNTFIPQPARYKIDSREMILAPDEGMEIKYNMKKGAGLIFSWTASAKLAYEFHGEPNKKPEGKGGTDYYESYDLDDKVGKDQSHATFIAPTTGIHGWFWHNKTAEPVTLKLVSAGFYDWLTENRHDKFTTIDPKDPQ